MTSVMAMSTGHCWTYAKLGDILVLTVTTRDIEAVDGYVNGHAVDSLIFA